MRTGRRAWSVHPLPRRSHQVPRFPCWHRWVRFPRNWHRVPRFPRRFRLLPSSRQLPSLCPGYRWMKSNRTSARPSREAPVGCRLERVPDPAGRPDHPGRSRSRRVPDPTSDWAPNPIPRRLRTIRPGPRGSNPFRRRRMAGIRFPTRGRPDRPSSDRSRIHWSRRLDRRPRPPSRSRTQSRRGAWKRTIRPTTVRLLSPVRRGRSPPRGAILIRRERNRTRRPCRVRWPIPIGPDSCPSFRGSLRCVRSTARRNHRASHCRIRDHPIRQPRCPGRGFLPGRARPSVDLPASGQSRSRPPPGRYPVDPPGRSSDRRSRPSLRHRGTMATRPAPRDLPAAGPPISGPVRLPGNPTRVSRAIRPVAWRWPTRSRGRPAAWSHPRSPGRRNRGCQPPDPARPAHSRRRSPAAPVAHGLRNKDGCRSGGP
jgi:hypothetical protein